MNTKILVVDDEQDFVELMAFNLRERGYEVLEASNGLEAVLHARRGQPDLILLDVMLGSMDGYTVCEILRRQPSTKQIPIIMVTAAAGEMARQHSVSSGADEFMSKPFGPHELLARIESTLRRHEEKMQALEAEEDQPV